MKYLSHGFDRHGHALWMLADALGPPHTWLWACPTLAHSQEHASMQTVSTSCRACHRESPTLMFVGKSDGFLLDKIGMVCFILSAGSSICFTCYRHLKTGNLLTGRGSSIAGAFVKYNCSCLLKETRIPPVILLLFSKSTYFCLARTSIKCS